MIIGVISLGSLFSYLEYSTGTKGGGGGFVPGLIAIILYFGPFFFLPKIAKSSMGAMGAIVNGVHSITHGKNGRGGAFGALKKGSQSSGKANRAKILAGQKSERFGGGLNRIGVGLSTGAKGNYGLGKKGAAAAALKRGDNVAQTLKNNHGLIELAKTDDNTNALLALSGGNGDAKHLTDRANEILGQQEKYKDGKDLEGQKAEAERMVKTAQSVGVNRANAQAALTTLAQTKSRALGAGQYQMVEKGIKELSRGDAHDEQSIAQTFQFNSRGAGRADLGGDWTDSRLSGLSVDEKRDEVMMQGLARTDAQSLAKGHPAAVRQAAATLQRRMLRGSTMEKRKEAAIRVIEMGRSLPYATGDTANAINAGLAGVGVLPGHGSVEQQVAMGVAGTERGATGGTLTPREQAARAAQIMPELTSKARTLGG
jgi:hypothetical protein